MTGILLKTMQHWCRTSLPGLWEKDSLLCMSQHAKKSIQQKYLANHKNRWKNWVKKNRAFTVERNSKEKRPDEAVLGYFLTMKLCRIMRDVIMRSKTPVECSIITFTKKIQMRAFISKFSRKPKLWGIIRIIWDYTRLCKIMRSAPPPPALHVNSNRTCGLVNCHQKNAMVLSNMTWRIQPSHEQPWP